MAEHSLVAHQFEDADQQREVATLGMWTFLSTEILFFGAVLVAYAVYRLRWPDAFRQGSIDLKWYLGGFNTAVLLISSFFMAMGVHAAQLGHSKKLIVYLILTTILGVLFLVVKGTEYYIEYEEGLVPGPITFKVHPPPESQDNGFMRGIKRFEKSIEPWTAAETENETRPPQERLFMTFYFILTAIHATHMIIGIGILLTLIVLTKRGHFTANHHNAVEIAGLYWHFVDTVWVFLFPILYLLRNP